MRSGDQTNGCILSDHKQLIYDPIVISPLLSLLFSKEWLNWIALNIFPQGTYLVGSLLVIGASVYYYFQKTELKQTKYAPVILTGSAMSIM